MKWHTDLYMGPSVVHKQKKIKWKIMHNAGQLGIYVIALAANQKNLLDIIPSGELLQKHYPKQELYIVGLAGSYEEALEVAGGIVSEVYRSTGGFALQEYILQKGKQDT